MIECLFEYHPVASVVPWADFSIDRVVTLDTPIPVSHACYGGQVIDRVARGERVTITRDGSLVAERWPYVPSKPSAEALLRKSYIGLVVPDGAHRILNGHQGDA